MLAKLHQAYEHEQNRLEKGAADWRTVPLTALIDRIVSVHHGYLRAELPFLSQFVNKIDRVHGGRHPELSTLNQLFHQLKAELEAHLGDEETWLFPLVATYDQGGDPGSDRGAAAQ